MDTNQYGHWLTTEKIGEGGGGIVYKAVRSEIIDSVVDTISGLSKQVYEKEEEEKKGFAKKFISTLHNHLSSGLICALKVPKATDSTALERIKREITAIAVLKHPNIIKLVDYDKVGFNWFVMEYHPSGTLDSCCQKYYGNVIDTLKAIRPVIEGLIEIHKNELFHRDIKPKNIFVTTDDRLILGDFGIVLSENEARLTSSTSPISRDWVPDWVRFEEIATFSAKVDIFMLAKVIYYMLTNKNVLASQLETSFTDFKKNLASQPLGIDLMYELFKEAIVTREQDGLQSASELLDKIDSILSNTSNKRPVAYQTKGNTPDTKQVLDLLSSAQPITRTKGRKLIDGIAANKQTVDPDIIRKLLKLIEDENLSDRERADSLYCVIRAKYWTASAFLLDHWINPQWKCGPSLSSALHSFFSDTGNQKGLERFLAWANGQLNENTNLDLKRVRDMLDIFRYALQQEQAILPDQFIESMQQITKQFINHTDAGIRSLAKEIIKGLKEGAL